MFSLSAESEECLKKLNDIESIAPYVTIDQSIGKASVAMYHVLALVSDSYAFDDKYYETPMTYNGTWLPYVRDFDPTLTISTDDHPHKDLDICINRKKYENWQLSNDDWTKSDDVKNFLDQVRMIDKNGVPWYALFYKTADASGNEYNKSRQSVWLSSTACLIKKSECQNFIDRIKDKSFYGRWFSPAEVKIRYNVFAREYVWSPAYINEYGDNNFIEAEIEVGKKKVRKTMPVLKYDCKETGYATVIDFDLEKVNFSEVKIQTEDVDVEEPVCEVIGAVMPCYHDYLWEEEYDYSKDCAIHISMPNGYIVNALKLEQKLDGVWQRGDEIVCADFKLIEGSNIDGLYIKEKYLRELLADEFSIVWIGLGEKRHTYGMSGIEKQSWNELSSLIYEDKTGQLKEIYISKPCGSNVKQ